MNDYKEGMQVVYLYAYIHIVVLKDNFTVTCFLSSMELAVELIEQILVNDVNLAASMLYHIAGCLNFPKWAHNSGKFIRGCCMKFNCG